MAARVGIFGGSFNPPHVAHLILAERARVEHILDRVLFVVAGQPPHKAPRPLAPGQDRLRMVELAIEGNPAFEASDMELRRTGASYTLMTVRELRGALGAQAELFLLMGGDSVLDLPGWWHARDLVREVRIVTFGRPGSALGDRLDGLAEQFGSEWVNDVRELMVDAPLMDISATEVRRRVREGLSVRYMVPEAVRRYIEERGLYRGG
jgi:nicotinate-nucleotide adenylyltransferase